MTEIDKNQKDKDTDEEVEKFRQEFQEHGIECGDKISKLAEIMHPDALLIVPLYRSCIVIEQNEEDKREGVATIHAYGDPHWLGGEITMDELKKDDFHAKFVVQGDRQGPGIFLENANKRNKNTGCCQE